jgi:hypothetical protein
VCVVAQKASPPSAEASFDRPRDADGGLPGGDASQPTSAHRAFGIRLEVPMAATIDFEHHPVNTKADHEFQSPSDREWIERCKALAVVLLIVVLGLVSGLAFGAHEGSCGAAATCEAGART